MNNPDFALGSVLASLLLVIACIFLFAFLMKKTNLLKNGQGKTAMKVVATLPLTNKGRVQIVELNGQHYLLGVTEQNISLLDKYSKPLTTDEPTTKEVNTSFATLLAKISRKSDA
ncbi:flagellar biosynthetic protein FliO [Psychromonas sp. MME2]|uniref:flagellar biosynthetic protein FliO n=1 Tax=unclassified Psychromonas TaxID=2614957 RepID=UPI00339C9C00